uniref:HAT C-terminal dimerisation domain-containing protein n=1 Tax=Globisporangium ultimum (strain ATCC 200006 / CBS 805.95 / DAOM BR144) TaxID=431595 RepID=K3WLT6_GLOUD
MHVPPEVQAAIQHFQPGPGLELKPSKPSETSVIFSWGVRLESITDPGVLYWLCLGSESCRAHPTAIRLSAGKTSKATKHLKEVHGVESDRTQLLGQRLPPLGSDQEPQPSVEARAVSVVNRVVPELTPSSRAEPSCQLLRAVAPEPPAAEAPAAPEAPELQTPALEVEKPPPIPVPPEVKAAIKRYTPETGFELLPPKPNESSFIFEWGVRVQLIGNSVGANQTAWICLASDECRSQMTMARLYGGRTSRATRHLKEAHGIASGKTSAEATNAAPPVPSTETTTPEPTPTPAVTAGTRALELLGDAASIEEESVPPLPPPPSAREVAGLSAMRVFLAVKAAIDSYVPEEGFVMMPPKLSERSIIFYWGVRVQAIAANGAAVVAWVCLASENCRARTTAFRLSSGKTSKATKHLKETHGIAYEYTSTDVTNEEEARAAAVDGAFNVHEEENLAEGDFMIVPSAPEVEDPRTPENLIAVKAAIKDYTAPDTETFALKPPTAAERSVIYEWGVRVHCTLEDGSDRLAWVCLATESCRATLTCLLLSGGKTSKATKHLRDVHGIIAEQPRLEICTADEANGANAGEEGEQGDKTHSSEHIKPRPRPVVRLPTTRIPLAVKAAIESFVPGPGFVAKPVRKAESSIINDWGVRVETISSGEMNFGWICLASAKCREQRIYTHLSAGKTSKATKHLKDAHGISTETSAAAYERSEKANRKRRRCEDSDLLRNSDLFYDDPGRIFVLLQTLRIVNSTLPYSHGEYPESLVLRDLAATATTPLPAFNAKVAAHCMVELFASARQEIVDYVGANRLSSNVKSLSIAASIWSSSKMSKDTKILGLRLYFVNKQWEIKSVLLGTRFVPSSSCAIESFHKWMLHVLRDFGLQPSDLLHATTHGRKHEVKWAINSLSLPWNWCVLDLSNGAITKACGMVNDATQSENLPMTQLIGRLAITVYQVKHEPVLSVLFAHLCEWLGNGIGEQLLDYQTHRFVGFTAFLQRVLEHWDALETWYDDRTVQARRTRTTTHGVTGSVPSFPLARDKDDLMQVFSMLEPITAIARKSQKLDECPTQVDLLTTLFQLRLSVLDATKPLRQCRIVSSSHALGAGGALPRYATPPPPANQVTYFGHTLSPLAASTRVLLRDAFHDSFFARYTASSPSVLDDARVSWLLEMQLLLHPAYKNFGDGLLKEVVFVCNAQRGVAAAVIGSIFDAIRTKVRQQILEMMRSVTSVQDDATVSSDPVEVDDSTSQGEEEQQQQQTSSPLHEAKDESRSPDHSTESAQCPYEAELERWLTSGTAVLARNADNTEAESILAFWRRQRERKQFKYLPLVARIVFSVPACTTQLERDFGVSERMLVSQRSRFANDSENSESVNGDEFHRAAAMSAFLNRNRDFVDVTQCAVLPSTTQAADANTPTNLRVGLAHVAQRDDVLTLDAVLSACYAATGAFNDEAYFY